jgi:hypothetical protein
VGISFLPVFDDYVAYVEGDDGIVHALNAIFGGIVARSPSGSFSPLTAADGVLYSLGAGNLCAFALPPQHGPPSRGKASGRVTMN